MIFKVNIIIYKKKIKKLALCLSKRRKYDYSRPCSRKETNYSYITVNKLSLN